MPRAGSYASNVVRALCMVAACVLWLAPAEPVRGQFGSNGLSSFGGNDAAAPEQFQRRGPQFKPTGPPVLVHDVKIIGNETISESKIFSYLKTRRDRLFDPELVQADVRRLASSGLFRDVRTYTEDMTAANGQRSVLVTFEVAERPTIRYVKFVGNRGIRDKILEKQVNLEVGAPVTPYTVKEARRKIEEFYHTSGYPMAQVGILEGDDPNHRGVVLQIEEGHKERILDIDFEGNTIATDGRLRTQIQSRPFWYIMKGKVDRRMIDEDVDRLTAYYRSLGYFRARIGRELDYTDSGKWLRLKYVIDEGPRYVVRNVSVVGNTKFTSDGLLERMELKSGDHFNLAKMNRDVNTLRDIYGGYGHIFADIQADPRFLEEPGQLDLVYDIKEGEQYRVGEIRVRIAGETPHTRQSVVLNRISLRPGDIIDIREVRASERRLKSSQLFVNEPARGVAPRIVVQPPEFDDTSLAESNDSPSSGGSYRGQSPDNAQGLWDNVRQMFNGLKAWATGR